MGTSNLTKSVLVPTPKCGGSVPSVIVGMPPRRIVGLGLWEDAVGDTLLNIHDEAQSCSQWSLSLASSSPYKLGGSGEVFSDDDVDHGVNPAFRTKASRSIHDSFGDG